MNETQTRSELIDPKLKQSYIIAILISQNKMSKKEFLSF
jgi:hypothetical protein